MVSIVVVVNLMSVIEVIPEDPMIVELFGHQLPTRPLVPPLCALPLQIIQCPISCHHQHHLVGLLYIHNMIALTSYLMLKCFHIPKLIVLHALKNILYWHPLRPVTPLLN